MPFWIFVAVANVLYWASWFHAQQFLVPFLIALLLGGISAPSFWAAVLIGAIFFLMLGAKELTFIHRARAYEMLGVALLFLGTLQMAARTEGLAQMTVPFAYVIFGVVFGVLREHTSRYEEAQGERGGEERRAGGMRSAMGGLLAWEYGSVLAGLPLERIPRSAALFAGVIALFFLTARRAEGNSQYVRACAGAALGALGIVFLAANWTL